MVLDGVFEMKSSAGETLESPRQDLKDSSSRRAAPVVNGDAGLVMEFVYGVYVDSWQQNVEFVTRSRYSSELQKAGKPESKIFFIEDLMEKCYLPKNNFKNETMMVGSKNARVL